MTKYVCNTILCVGYHVSQFWKWLWERNGKFFLPPVKDKIEIAICLLMFGYFEPLGKFRIGLLSKRTWRKSIDTKPKSSTWY